jgi:dihydrofolate reductase
LTVRKLKLQVQMSVDGFIAGLNGEMDWMVWDWDNELETYVNELTEPVDTILLGRKMADGFISHWTDIMTKPDDPKYASAKKMIDTPKVVFTKTLNKSKWANTTVAGDLADEVNQLKNKKGKDIIVYGGASLDSSLIKAGLIDEYHLSVNPTALGNGLTIFRDLNERRNLSLVKSTGFGCGIVLLHYEPKKPPAIAARSRGNPS